MEQLKVLRVTPRLRETAMPYIWEGTYSPPWAKNMADNEKQLEFFESRHPKKVATYTSEGDDWDLMYLKFGGQDIYYVSAEGLIQYCVEVDEFSINDYGISTLAQTSVWRNKAFSELDDLAKWVFFKVLFPKYGTVLSDDTQSIDGKNFWSRRAKQAIDLGLNVYALGLYGSSDLTVCEIYQIFKTKEMRQYYTEGEDKSGKYYRFLITKKALEEV